MLSRLDLRTGVDASTLADSLPRAAIDIDAALEAVRPLVADVKIRGTDALLDQAEQFDGIRPSSITVPQEAIDQALETLNPELIDALKLAIGHVRIGHELQMPEEKSVEVIPGGTVTQRWVPMSRVGLYVPGGLAVYPSSVVMNAVCAQVAGVGSIALTSPAQKEFGGLPHPTILAACALLGIDEVYAAGGAGAIGMFAYGAGDCAPVDVITGPGNIYVAAAKRLVHGTVGIDSEAGTTEIAILADKSADPRYVAADLLSQAEHDPAAASVLVTDSSELADAVDVELERQASLTKHSERVREALTGPQSGTVLVSSLEDGLAVINAYGAEHLEIHTEDARGAAARVHNAGAIFVGPYTPVPAGDYLAGSNHVLPTGGTARFSAGLNVHAFLKSVQQVEYTKEALEKIATPLVTFANAEDLPAHGDALTIRSTDR